MIKKTKHVRCDIWKPFTCVFVSELESSAERVHHVQQIIVTLPRTIIIVMRYLFAFLNQWVGALHYQHNRIISVSVRLVSRMSLRSDCMYRTLESCVVNHQVYELLRSNPGIHYIQSYWTAPTVYVLFIAMSGCLQYFRSYLCQRKSHCSLLYYTCLVLLYYY